MNEKTANLLKDVRKMTPFDVHQMVGTKTPQSELYIAAKVELERRERRDRFWRKDIVAWLALVLAIISLGFSILAYYFTGRPLQ